MTVYQRNPLAEAVLKARQAHAAALEDLQQARALLAEERAATRKLRADKVRLQARIADLKKYRPQAPSDAEPLDDAAARLRAATQEIAQHAARKKAA